MVGANKTVTSYTVIVMLQRNLDGTHLEDLHLTSIIEKGSCFTLFGPLVNNYCFFQRKSHHICNCEASLTNMAKVCFTNSKQKTGLL